MAASVVSFSRASPAHRIRRRFLKWAAVRPAAAKAGLRKLPFADSGRRIAAIWACESGTEAMIENVYQMIARAQAEYARCIDDDRLEEWPNHFHGQCIYRVTTAANHREGLEAGLFFAKSPGKLADRGLALCEANIYERQAYPHILWQPSVLSAHNGEVRREMPFLV